MYRSKSLTSYIFCKFIGRHFSLNKKPLKQQLTSNDIRQEFLNYFINENGHKFIKSSPVVPFNDPSVSFVNAGMNQFKSIFLGKKQPHNRRVANSQKCIRVGGKHNDLSIVGKDGYHHTFFEMLGNWSFGDYFKKEACEMAFELLTGPLNIDKSRLYMTYFNGDSQLGIPPDLECVEIWRYLGIAKERILPFGIKENFWEMGSTGPCGPCTEIHIDHLPNSCPSTRAIYVNAGRSDLTELWNIVFIQYNRNIDQSIDELPQKHIDTGMGLERLSAIIQNKSTNYETDLFVPIFKKIQEISHCLPYNNSFNLNSLSYVLDTAHRILADHVRMIAVCLSDGMLPDQNHKLRRIIRKSILVSENSFKYNNFLNKIIPTVVEILGLAYPEMYRRLPNILEIISHEEEIFKALRLNTAKEFDSMFESNSKINYMEFIDLPGFLPAYKELNQNKKSYTNGIIPNSFLFKMYDTYGLDLETINKIAEMENLQVHSENLLTELTKNKEKYKQQIITANGYTKNSFLHNEYPNTNDSFKYDYEYNCFKNKFEIRPLQAKILRIFENNIEHACNGRKIFNIVTDKTNFYCESGGQNNDKGKIVKLDNGETKLFNVKKVFLKNGYVFHSGEYDDNYKNSMFHIDEDVHLCVDEDHRTGLTLHHTATHILNSAVRSVCKRTTYQLSSAVEYDQLKLELGILGAKLTLDDISAIEDLVRKIIKLQIPVNVFEVCADDIVSMENVITVPGEVYPEFGLRLLSIQNESQLFCSKELCCGTHASNTLQLEDFRITSVKQISRARYLFNAVTGLAVKKVEETESNVLSKINILEKEFKAMSRNYDRLEYKLQKLRNEIFHGDSLLPYVTRAICAETITSLEKQLKENSREAIKEFLNIEMTNLLEKRPIDKYPYIVHFLDSSSLLENVSLQKATRLCKDRPIMVISVTNNIIKARCCVPKSQISDNFTAKDWLINVSNIFNAQISAPKGQNIAEVCNMRPKRLVPSTFDDQLDNALQAANEFAMKFIMR